jgi:hypothetical protein
LFADGIVSSEWYYKCLTKRLPPEKSGQLPVASRPAHPWLFSIGPLGLRIRISIVMLDFETISEDPSSQFCAVPGAPKLLKAKAHEPLPGNIISRIKKE